MKKRYLLITCLLVGLLSLQPAYARAGGGGGGGASGGSSGGGGSSHSSSSSNSTSSPASFMVEIASIVLIMSVGSVSVLYYRFKVAKKSHHTRNLLKEIDDRDAFWEESHLQQMIEDIYYTTQACWSEKKIEPLKPILSEDLYENWKMKIDWMDIRKERNVLEHVKLLSSHIVGIYDAKDNEYDMFWVAMRGKMIDYTIREEDHEIIKGDTSSHEFFEYWKFIRKKDNILLDEIRQKDEMDVDAFINLSEEHADEDNGSGLRNP